MATLAAARMPITWPPAHYHYQVSAIDTFRTTAWSETGIVAAEDTFITQPEEISGFWI